MRLNIKNKESTFAHDINYLRPIFELVNFYFGFMNKFFNAGAAMKHITFGASDSMAGCDKLLIGLRL